jgi:hypothetical protein
MGAHQLAQLNVGGILAPMDSAVMAGFAGQLAAINALADAAPGFVWRLQTESGDATSIRAVDDEYLIVNTSVWESPETLRSFVYRSAHVDVMRRRREWFAHERAIRGSLVGAGRSPSHRPGGRRAADDARP